MENILNAILWILSYLMPKTYKLIIETNKLKLSPLETIDLIIDNNVELTLIIAILCIALSIKIFKKLKHI